MTAAATPNQPARTSTSPAGGERTPAGSKAGEGNCSVSPVTQPASGRLPAQPVTPSGRLLLDHEAPRDVWLDARRGGLGSSDIPIVLGISDFKTPLHIYHDKRGEIPHDDSFSEPAHFGTIFEEPLALDWARRKRTVVERIGIIANLDEPWQLCTLDRLCRECPYDRSTHKLCALEVKCRNAYVAKLWRTGPPDDVLAQVLWQILVTGLDHIHVMCLIGGNDPRMYTVRLSDHIKTVAYINAEAARFWHEHIVPGIPPELTGSEAPDALMDLYQRLHPERDGVVVVDRNVEALDAVGDYLAEGDVIREAKVRQKAAKARMLAELGSAQAATRGDKPFYSIEQSEKSTCDLALLRDEFPDAYAKCVTDKAHDRLHIPGFVREEHTA